MTDEVKWLANLMLALEDHVEKLGLAALCVAARTDETRHYWCYRTRRTASAINITVEPQLFTGWHGMDLWMRCVVFWRGEPFVQHAKNLRREDTASKSPLRASSSTLLQSETEWLMSFNSMERVRFERNSDWKSSKVDRGGLGITLGLLAGEF